MKSARHAVRRAVHEAKAKSDSETLDSESVACATKSRIVGLASLSIRCSFVAGSFV